jgi:hypothetical protein
MSTSTSSTSSSTPSSSSTTKVTSKSKSSAVKRPRTDFSTLKTGDRLSETQYYEVVSTDTTRMRVRNERGFEFNVSKEIVEEGMFNANQFTETKKISRTAMVDILESTNGHIFTVNFDKKPTDQSVLEVLKSFTIADFGDSAKLSHISEKIARGENRTLTGYMIAPEVKMGRSKVIDLNEDAPANSRLVDHRTLNWLIFKGVKYTC